MKLSAMRARRPDQSGFTLIEVMVVMIIIAILAALAIPVFFRQRDKGLVSQVQAALANGRIAAESYRTGDGDGDFDNDANQDMDRADLNSEGLRVADTVVLDVFVTPDAQTYCIQTVHFGLDPGHEWHIATQETDGDSTTTDDPSPDDDCFD